MDGILRWVRGYLTSAFLGGAEGRRRVMFVLLAGLLPVSTAATFVFAGGDHRTALVLRLVGFAIVLTWLIVRRRPSQAEWIAMWTIIPATWIASQYSAGAAYAGAIAISGIAVFTVAAVVFDRFIIGYAAVTVACAYTVVQLHFHPTSRALVAVLLLVMVEATVVLIIGGTARFLRESLREVNDLHTRMADTADQERARIAGALHDDTVQALTAAGLALDGLVRRLDNLELGGEAATARGVREMVQGASERTRRLSFDLYPPQLGDRGLAPAIHALGEQVAPEDVLQVVIDAPDVRYPGEVERLAYRTIRELLSNARRHAQATRVVVTVAARNGSLRCSVADNGRGFDAATWDEARRGHHMGLDTTAERVRMAGGEFAIDSEPGGGTQASFSLPIHRGQI